MLNDLGIDSIDARNHLRWLWEKHAVTPEHTSSGKSGKRRSKFYHSLLQSLDLQDSDELLQAYLNLTEVISASGLCIFTIGTCTKLTDNVSGFSISDLLTNLLQSTTGIQFQEGDLLNIAVQNLSLIPKKNCEPI